MSLTIPEDLLNAAQMSADEFRLENAVWLYQTQRLSLARAARWAGLTRLEFQRELAKRGVPVYTEEEFRQDLGTLESLSQP